MNKRNVGGSPVVTRSCKRSRRVRTWSPIEVFFNGPLVSLSLEFLKPTQLASMCSVSQRMNASASSSQLWHKALIAKVPSFSKVREKDLAGPILSCDPVGGLGRHPVRTFKEIASNLISCNRDESDFQDQLALAYVADAGNVFIGSHQLQVSKYSIAQVQIRNIASGPWLLKNAMDDDGRIVMECFHVDAMNLEEGEGLWSSWACMKTYQHCDNCCCADSDPFRSTLNVHVGENDGSEDIELISKDVLQNALTALSGSAVLSNTTGKQHSLVNVATRSGFSTYLMNFANHADYRFFRRKLAGRNRSVLAFQIALCMP